MSYAYDRPMDLDEVFVLLQGWIGWDLDVTVGAAHRPPPPSALSVGGSRGRPSSIPTRPRPRAAGFRR